jgi:WhiB family redox-sensing transcriptional regulator
MGEVNGLATPTDDEVEALAGILTSGLPPAEELMAGHDGRADGPVVEIDLMSARVAETSADPSRLTETAVGLLRLFTVLPPGQYIDSEGIHNVRLLPTDVLAQERRADLLKTPLSRIRRIGAVAGQDILLTRRQQVGCGSITKYALAPGIRFVDAPGREDFGIRLSEEERRTVATLAMNEVRVDLPPPPAAPQDKPIFSMARGSSESDWRHRAICRDEDPELFFPVGTSGPALMQIAEAKSVCRRCPVVSECLQWALEAGQDSGVWGGLSENERRALKRHRARRRAHTV